MALSNFIPTIWSETLANELDQKYIAVKHCNRDFEGDIKAKGSTVKICGIGDISVFDYTKNTDMDDPDELTDSASTLSIDQAKAFNFQIDDVEKAQSIPKVMQAAMKKAASALACEADKYIFSLVDSDDVTETMTVTDLTTSNVLDAFMSARTAFYENNVYDSDEMVFEVSPEIAKYILKSKLEISTDNADELETGCIGRLFGTKVYVSGNIVTEENEAEDEDDEDTVTHKCIARTKRSVAYAEQLSEIEAYRPEKRFADAVKGLHLYGAKIVYPKEFMVMNFVVA